MKPLLTTKEAARVLGMTPEALSAWRCRGLGPAAVNAAVGKKPRFLYRPEDLEAWLRDKQKPVEAAPLAPKEAAALLGVHHKTLETWRREGRGPKAFKVGGTLRARVRYYAHDIEEWLAVGRFKQKEARMQHDRDYYRSLDDLRLIEEGKTNPNTEVCIALAERLEDFRKDEAYD